MVEAENEQKEAKEERERGKNPELDKIMKGWSPRSPFPKPNSDPNIVHDVQDRVPHICFDISPHIFVKSLPRAAVLAPNFQGFLNLEVVG